MPKTEWEKGVISEFDAGTSSSLPDQDFRILKANSCNAEDP
jgi:hypothetical protein